MTAVHCMMHQGHVIAKHLVEVLEKWDWFEDGCGVTEEAPGWTFFGVKYCFLVHLRSRTTGGELAAAS
eukprot:5302270-Pyramimonas_sp.AAC.1